MGMENAIEPISIFIVPNRHIFGVHIIYYRFLLNLKRAIGMFRNPYRLVPDKSFFVGLIPFYDQIIFAILTPVNSGINGKCGNGT